MVLLIDKPFLLLQNWGSSIPKEGPCRWTKKSNHNEKTNFIVLVRVLQLLYYSAIIVNRIEDRSKQKETGNITQIPQVTFDICEIPDNILTFSIYKRVHISVDSELVLLSRRHSNRSSNVCLYFRGRTEGEVDWRVLLRALLWWLHICLSSSQWVLISLRIVSIHFIDFEFFNWFNIKLNISHFF